jgi:hypothetical protein
MSKLDKNKKIGHDTIKGVSESEIQAVENKLNIKFPLAYKEFLLLAGDYTGNLRIAEGHTSLDMLSKDTVLNNMRNQLNKYGPHITRPFWVIGEKDNFDQFYFFYLDENTEDPIVWGVTHASNYNDPNIIVPLNMTFSAFINEVIDKSIHFSKHGY